jgi:hypothetical protein
MFYTNAFMFCTQKHTIYNSYIFLNTMFYSMQYPLYTIMVFDEWGNGVLVAFFVISTGKKKALRVVLIALKRKLLSVNKDWEPAAIIVDNSQAKLNVLGYGTMALNETAIQRLQ